MGDLSQLKAMIGNKFGEDFNREVIKLQEKDIKVHRHNKSKENYGDSKRKIEHKNNSISDKQNTKPTYNKDNRKYEKTTPTSDSKKREVSSNGNYFVNPYNFISHGEKAIKNKTKEKGNHFGDDKLLTGVINCVLKTKTPIFIPNITNDDAFGLVKIESVKTEESKEAKREEKHKSFDFFSYNDLSGKNTKYNPKEPIIPGSSIRGVIRSAFEALTDSCLMTYDKPVTLREAETKVPGILEYENGSWKLYEAEKLMIKTGICDRDEGAQYKIEKDEKNNRYIVLNEKRKYTGDEIMFGEVDIYRKNVPCKLAKNIGSGEYSGILLLGEPFGIKKHHDSIFTYNDKPKKEVEGDLTRAIEGLTEVLRVYKDPAVNKNLIKGHNGYRHYSLNGKVKYPVWYKKIGNRLYLSPACISRTACYTTIPDLLQKHGGYDACKNYEKVCAACELFGMVGDNSALGSKIRFSDAKLTDESKNKNEYYDIEPVTLDEMSSPKPAAVEFYTKRPNGNISIWNYDDCCANNNCIEILGRKFYWHSENYNKYYKKAIKPNKRNTTIRTVTKDIEFQFNIYYEKITEDELQKLLWVLTIGENEINGKMCHKIGGAKPLGFGSVKIKVNKVKKRKFNFRNGTIVRESKNLDDTYVDTLINNTPFTGTSYDEFIKITDFDYMKNEKINYPFGEIIDNKNNSSKPNSKGGHVWFKLNRIDGVNEMDKKIKYTLTFDNPKLPQLKQEKN